MLEKTENKTKKKSWCRPIEKNLLKRKKLLVIGKEAVSLNIGYYIDFVVNLY